MANESRKIAVMYHVNEEKAAIAGYLHDISAIFPNEVRITVAEEFGIDLLEEERKFPMIIHQNFREYSQKRYLKCMMKRL